MRLWSSIYTVLWKGLDSFLPSSHVFFGIAYLPAVYYLISFHHVYPFRQPLYVTEIGITVGVFCRRRYHSEIAGRARPPKRESEVYDDEVSDRIANVAGLVWVYSHVTIGIVDIGGGHERWCCARGWWMLTVQAYRRRYVEPCIIIISPYPTSWAYSRNR